MSRRRTDALPFLALAALGLSSLVSGSARADDPEEWERDAPADVFFASPKDEVGYPTHLVLRIVDDISGDALPGATVALHSQREYPTTGLFGADMTGIADEDGWVRMRPGWRGWMSCEWAYVEAPGHAGAAVRPGDNEIEIRLQRAQDVVVQVRDGLDRPVDGAVLGVRVSSTCGHMNDQRVSVTGADGLAVVHGLCRGNLWDWNFDWEAWVVADGIESDYRYLRVPTRPAAPQVLRFGPSRPVTGTILDPAGKPLAGVHVGLFGFHRGPWSLTDAEGTFRLVGWHANLDLQAIREYEGMYEKGRPADPRFDAPPPGVKRAFRMPRPGEPLVEEPRLAVRITARDANTKEPLEDVDLVAYRDGDGWTTREAGEIKALPHGTFTVLAGEGLSRYASTKGRIEVADEMPAPLVLDVARNPDVPVVVEDDPGEVEIVLVSADHARNVGEDEVKAGRVAVPPGVECAFRVTVHGNPESRHDERHVEFVPIPVEGRGPGMPPIHIHATRTAVVKARFAGPDGEPVPGWLVDDVEEHVGGSHYERWPSEGPPAQAEPSVTRLEEGPVELLAIPEGKAFLPRIVSVTVPAGARGGPSIDLGVLRLEPRGDRRLTIERADGKPAELRRLRVVHEGALRELPLEEEGVYDPVLVPLATGDLVEATGSFTDDPGVAPRKIRWTLSGPGPWTLKADDDRTSLAVEPRDDAGKEIDATLVIDGTSYAPTWWDDAGKRHPVEVRGLTPGPHRVAVAAADRITRLYRVVLKDGERRVLSPRLRPAPPPSAPTAK